MKRGADHILLVGMMGSGKTTIGELLADRLGRRFVDSDAEIEKSTGRSVAQIFAADGEIAFRAEERRVLWESIGAYPPAVIAVAGGAVLDEQNRSAIRSAGSVVWLRADPATLVDRLGDGSGRPLIEGKVEQAVADLDVERRPCYAGLADVTLDVDGNPPDVLVETLLEKLQHRVAVALGDRAYEVVIGPGARLFLASLMPPKAVRAAIVTQDGIDVSLDLGIDTRRFTIGDSEATKSLRTIEELCRGFAQMGLTRHDVIVGVGGGMVTDIAGFAAACYHRGTNVVHVSTSLLGQVDAAVGGKTGVNLPEGKNLVGAFYQPFAVICDTDTLTSLPEREWRSGCGEIAKYAFLGADDLDELVLVDQITRCIEVKAAVVASDERESGNRFLLNYGHTLAHALEAAGFAEGNGRAGIDLRHGEAVAIGIVFAARLAESLGRIDAGRVKRHIDVVESYGLSVEVPAGVDVHELMGFIAHDKKVTSGLSFILDGSRGLEMVNDIDPSVVEQTLEYCVDDRRVRLVGESS